MNLDSAHICSRRRSRDEGENHISIMSGVNEIDPLFNCGAQLWLSSLLPSLQQRNKSR
jgi:hypothetical protein